MTTMFPSPQRLSTSKQLDCPQTLTVCFSSISESTPTTAMPSHFGRSWGPRDRQRKTNTGASKVPGNYSFLIPHVGFLSKVENSGSSSPFLDKAFHCFVSLGESALPLRQQTPDLH